MLTFYHTLDRVTFIQEESHTLNQIVQDENQSDVLFKTQEKKTIKTSDIKTESKINSSNIYKNNKIN